MDAPAIETQDKGVNAGLSRDLGSTSLCNSIISAHAYYSSYMLRNSSFLIIEICFFFLAASQNTLVQPGKKKRLQGATLRSLRLLEQL